MPDRLPPTLEFDWTVDLPSDGLGGVAANDEIVVVGCRDALNRKDVWVCLDVRTGAQIWTLEYLATHPDESNTKSGGELDYGNSPRATPLITDTHVYLMGAFGHLFCVDRKTGKDVWYYEFQLDFDAALPTWGFCESPILVDGKIIVQPGAPEAAVVAFNALTGDIEWEVKGAKPGYSSFVAGSFSNRPQLIGYDEKTLGGWDISDGERLWTVHPDRPGDFNVPTPILSNQRLIVATENNGTRSFNFDDRGISNPVPNATFKDLSPDMHSPVLVGNRILGVDSKLYCLDLALNQIWVDEDLDFTAFCSMISDGKSKLLVLTGEGKLILNQISGEQNLQLGKLDFDIGNEEVLAHPALVDGKLIVRFNQQIHAIDLK